MALTPRSGSSAETLRFVRVAHAAEFQPGTVEMVRAEGRWYALANVDGRLYALDNDCPHNGGRLGKGRLRGRELECPRHGWRWDVTTGRSCWPDTNWRARQVPVRVEGDDVLLGLL